MQHEVALQNELLAGPPQEAMAESPGFQQVEQDGFHRRLMSSIDNYEITD